MGVLKHISFPRFFIIGVSLFLSKFMLLLTAYILNSTDYNLFNKYYYTAGLVITFSILGFDYAFSRENISLIRMSFYVLIQIILFSFALSFFDDHENTFLFTISVLMYSFFIVFSNVVSFRILFDGKYVNYFVIFLTYSVLHILMIVFIPPENYIYYFPISGLLWFATVVYFSKDYYVFKGSDIKVFYKLALSGFIINSSLSIGIVFIKFVVNNYYTANTANAFTFSWGIAAPVYYIGNLIEKYIYSLDKEKKPGQTRKSMYLLFVLILLYSTSAIIILNYFPKMLPSSVDSAIIFKIFIIMITGYGLYCILHFPFNGYLFKYAETYVQKAISKIFVVIVVLYVIMVFVFGDYITSNYKFLLGLFFAYIFTLLGVKTYVIVRYYKMTRNPSRRIFDRENVSEKRVGE